jgi:hypothetical protein
MGSPREDRTLTIFEGELRHLINYHSLESGCDMPDHAIARYLRQAYENLCEASRMKVFWSQEKHAAPNGDGAVNQDVTRC